MQSELEVERARRETSGAARFDLPGQGLDQVVPASVHYYTTDDDLDRLLRVLPLAL